MRVLLVEDNSKLIAQFKLLVSAIGGARVVHVSKTDADAIAWLERHPGGWDLALVDIFLASGHGFNVLKRCQKVEPAQRIVIVSNYAKDGIRERALSSGADRFFDKSLELEELISYCRETRRSLQ